MSVIQASSCILKQDGKKTYLISNEFYQIKTEEDDYIAKYLFCEDDLLYIEVNGRVRNINKEDIKNIEVM